MSKREMICIRCPLGCRLEVAFNNDEIDDGNHNRSCTGNGAGNRSGNCDGNGDGNCAGSGNENHNGYYSNNVMVSGNSCPKGEAYGIKELTNPTRTLTTTVRAAFHEGRDGIVPVKTAGEIPKDKMMECMAAIKRVVVEPPVQIGDVVLENVADTGVNVVAAGNYKE